MSELTPFDVFDYFATDDSDLDSRQLRIRNAILRPGTDSDADRALVRFRAEMKAINRNATIREQLTAFSAGLRETLEQDRAELDQSVADQIENWLRSLEQRSRQLTWRQLFDRLLLEFRTQIAQNQATPPIRSAEELVSTVISSLLNQDQIGQFADMRDPNQLWPVLLQIAARKADIAELTTESMAESHFQEELDSALESAFTVAAKSQHERQVLAYTLLGRTPDQIAEITEEIIEDVATQIRALHARLHSMLTAA